jgi:hypothetical protein
MILLAISMILIGCSLLWTVAREPFINSYDWLRIIWEGIRIGIGVGGIVGGIALLFVA